MVNQEREQDFPPQQEIPPANSSHDGGFTVLQLPQPPIADAAIKPPLRKCTSCGFGPPPSSLYQPCSKRGAMSTSSPDPTPPSSSQRKRQRSPLPLRRSLSDFPCSPIGVGVGVGGAYYYYQDFPNPPAAAAAALLKNPLSPSQMPPLHRSPPSNPFNEQQAVNTRPQQIVRPQMFDHHHHGSPNSKKLRREVKGKVEELMQAFCEPQQDDEDDDDDDDEVDVNISCINKEKAEMMNQNQDENEGGDEDSVWVKQTEGGLILHFNCPCGEGYEVFLNGDKCYYRLA